MVTRPVILLGWLALGCGPAPAPAPPTPAGAPGAGLSPEVVSRVSLLMECEECTAGEQDTVVALGQQAVSVLRLRLLQGPPPERVAAYRSFLVERLSTLRRLRAGGPLAGTPDSTAYIQGLLANYRATYQVRAAMALGRIGGSEAKTALLQASQQPNRADVAEAIRFVLDRVWTP